jgi:hypothetical protein
MIGPPGLPKFGRRIFAFAGPAPAHARERFQPLKWAAGLYLAGVLAHFSHHLAMDVWIDGLDPSLNEALISAPTSLVWPADLIHTLINQS